LKTEHPIDAVGSGESMKTPTDCYDSIYPKESTYQYLVRMS
jgi:hypothetical protein